MVPNGESGDGGDGGNKKGNIIPFPISRLTDPDQEPEDVASWLESQVIEKLKKASKKFNNDRLKPRQEDITDVASIVSEIIDSIYEVMELIDDLGEDAGTPLMSIWGRLENGNDGILERLNMIGGELINLGEAANLDSAKKIELNYGQRVQSVKSNFRQVERDLKNLIKHLRSLTQ